MTSMTLLAQLPSAFPVEWGITAILGVCLSIMAALVRNLVLKTTSALEAQTKTLTDFVDRHRGETTAAIAQVANAVTSSSDRFASTVGDTHTRLSGVLERQERRLEEALWQFRIMELVKQAKAEGIILSQEELERLLRAAAHERQANGEK